MMKLILKRVESVSSPIARGLIAKSEGDEVIIVTPGGEKYLKFDRVDYI